jgi:hypothetical protein
MYLVDTADINTADEIRRTIARLYTDAKIQEIVNTLGVLSSGVNPTDVGREIRNWAEGYLSLQCTMDKRNGRAGAAKSLADLRRAAQALAAALDKLDKEAIGLLADRSSIKTPLFGEVEFKETTKAREKLGDARDISLYLIKATGKAASQIPKARVGRKPHTDREIAVRGLAHIYLKSSGKMPTARYDSTSEKFEGSDKFGKFYGPFRSFCLAALGPIEGRTVKVGLDPLIAKVLYQRPQGPRGSAQDPYVEKTKRPR